MKKRKLNLLSKSANQLDYNQARLEWAYFGECYDGLRAINKCELCGKSHIRYLYVIVNRFNNQKMEVGSHCIIEYMIPVYDQGNFILGKQAEKIINIHKKVLKEKSRPEVALSILREIVEKDSTYQGFYSFYKKNNYFTPYQISRIAKLNVNIKVFDVLIKGRYQEDYNSLKDYQLSKIKGCRLIK